MPYVDDNIIYTDDGVAAGEVVQAPDGNFVAVSFDGATPDGTPLSPDGYEVDSGADQYVTHDEFAAFEQQQLQQRIAHLEAQAQQLPQHVQPVPPHDPEREMAIIQANFDQVAKRAGRDLTTKEVEGILGKMQDQI